MRQGGRCLYFACNCHAAQPSALSLPTHAVLALKDEGVRPCRHGGQHSSTCRNLCCVAAAGCLDEGNIAQQAEGGGQDADGLRKRAKEEKPTTFEGIRKRRHVRQADCPLVVGVCKSSLAYKSGCTQGASARAMAAEVLLMTGASATATKRMAQRCSKCLHGGPLNPSKRRSSFRIFSALSMSVLSSNSSTPTFRDL